ncbi:hypothetical protein EBAPG3_009540 [Nitrosospira lacus]|uniref:Uncharacterized protein n=1 Tax=Nitrosospira lacus TaxID=1288494 RepID=A0A1W6SQC8_9PROT|nr:hypothetical protein [Nitrosospira lacus]ARO87991.1 hypothetical protein EBAPG3_009540 [Nitrosospira lacus]
MRNLKLGNRRFCTQVKVPSDFQSVLLRGRLAGLALDEYDILVRLLKGFEAAVKLGMFSDVDTVREGATSEILSYSAAPPSFQFELNLCCQHPSALRVLINMFYHALGSKGGDIVHISLDSGIDVVSAYFTEYEVMKAEYISLYNHLPFKVIFASEECMAVDPVIRVIFAAAVLPETFVHFRDAIKIWDFILLYGGYNNQSDKLIDLPLSEAEIYLLSPTILEHPIFNILQSSAYFSSFCRICARIARISQPIRAIEIQ